MEKMSQGNHNMKRDDSKYSNTCSVCATHYTKKNFPNHCFRDDPKKGSKCSNCWGKDKFNCPKCEKVYVSQYENARSATKPSQTECYDCSSLFEKMLAKTEQEICKLNEFNSAFRILVTYYVSFTMGCYMTETYKMCKIKIKLDFPLFNAFKNDDIDRLGNVSNGTKLVLFYTIGCDDLAKYYDKFKVGFDELPCEIQYISIDKAKIIPAKRQIDLKPVEIKI